MSVETFAKSQRSSILVQEEIGLMKENLYDRFRRLEIYSVSRRRSGERFF